MTAELSLQERYAPGSACFGCGPSNAQGLRIRSFARGDEVVCDWSPEPHHKAFPGVLAGGIVGTLLDCHGNWTAAHHIMTLRGLDHMPTAVTASYAIRLLRPTPTEGSLHLRAWVVEAKDPKVRVDGELLAGGEVCATLSGTFVAVREGHPAFGRW